jgi:hypothetical protein
MKRAGYALGFRVHSGWAAMVAVAGSPTEPEVIDRRRIEIADRTIAGSVQPYHMARDLAFVNGSITKAGIEKARKHLDRGQQDSRELAVEALRKAMVELGDRRAVACGMLVGSGRLPATLEATLGSHAAIHTAEGEFFREAILHAAKSCKLTVRRVKEKQLFDVAAGQFGMAGVELVERINELRGVLGSPWQQDQKYAALVGWLAAG